MGPLLVALHTALAAPEPTSVDFTWRAPLGCPVETDVRAQIERHLGRSLERYTGGPLSVSATVESAGHERWVVRVVSSVPGGEDRERVVRPDGDCERAAKAAALIVALAIDPNASAGKPDAEPVPEPVPEPAPEREPDLSSETRPDTPPAPEPPRSEAQLRGAVSAFGSLGFGALPGANGAFGAGMGLLGRRWRTDARAAYGLAPVSSVGPSSSVRFRQWRVGVRAGWVFGAGASVSIPVCGGVEAGQVIVTPIGLDEPRNVRSPWFAVTFGPGIHLALGRALALVVEAQGVVPMLRPNYTVGGAGSIHRALPVGLRGQLGIEVRFP